MKRFILCLGFAACVFRFHAAFAATGQADIRPTQEGSQAGGTVKLEDTAHGLHVTAVLKGLTPGDHGFHIHEKGDCSDGGNAAGGHYNPTGVQHGLATKHGETAHAGDLGNLTAGADGTAKLEAVLPGVILSGPEPSVEGRAFIVHEKADDFGQPTGNAGGRVACGEIKVTAVE